MFKKAVFLGKILYTLTPLVFSLLFVIGTLGNILVAYVTLTPSTNRFTTRPIHSMLVLNLAAADLVYLVSSLPYQVSELRYLVVVLSWPSTIFTAKFCFNYFWKLFFKTREGLSGQLWLAIRKLWSVAEEVISVCAQFKRCQRYGVAVLPAA